METQTLKGKVRERINTFMEQVLDYTEVAISDPHGYKVIRAKILRVGNNCMRIVDAEFEKVKGDTQDDR
jgi:hypothetical protein